MFGLFKSPADKLIAKLKNRESMPFEDEQFYPELQKALAAPHQWREAQKRALIKASLALFTGMDGWRHIGAEDWPNIWAFSQDRAVLNCLQLIANTFPDVPEAQPLHRILTEVARIQQRQQQPIYDHHQTPSVIFQDMGLKLAVINQLMFIENRLLPAFDFDLFREEYTKRCVDDWYGASPEVFEYFRQFDLPQALLDRVETLTLTQAPFYGYLCHPLMNLTMSYRSGYSLQITQQAVSDVAFLPNLREICLDPAQSVVITQTDGQMSASLGREERQVAEITGESSLGFFVNEDFISQLKAQGITFTRQGKPLVW